MSFKEKVANKLDGLYSNHPEAQAVKQQLDAEGIKPAAHASRATSIEGRFMDAYRDNRRRPADDGEDPNEAYVGKSQEESVVAAGQQAITPEAIAAERPTQEHEVPTQEQIDAAEKAGDTVMTHVVALETQAAQADFEAASRAMSAEEQDPNKLH